MPNWKPPSGETARSVDMNTTTRGAAASSSSSLSAIVVAAFVGVAIVFTAGMAQSDALHDAAHDVRHATGFPCH